MWSLIINLISAAIAAVATWGYQKFSRKRLRNRRLRELQQAATAGEVAICVRVGGLSDPVPDVLKYLREHHPAVSNLLVYRVSAEEAEEASATLDSPITAQRIIEDIREGIRAYGKAEIARVHFFPSGMIAYPFMLGAMVGNWIPVVVYHRSKDAYIPLYEMSRDWIQQGKRGFEFMKAWEVLPIMQATEIPALSFSQALAPPAPKQITAPDNH
jgi:SMODS-associated and fused to various effectors sensor domain